ncbi:hypothetical protein [Nannocystis pusilla]|uniref:hypothetical protein n=1 Tax=Nannocystis pusilla TaxID=889268 RepID=UPI003B7B52FE
MRFQSCAPGEVGLQLEGFVGEAQEGRPVGLLAGVADVGQARGEGVGGIDGELLEQAIGGVPVARAGVPAGGDPPAVALLGRIGAGEQALAERAVTVVVLGVAVGHLEQLDGVVVFGVSIDVPLEQVGGLAREAELEQGDGVKTGVLGRIGAAVGLDAVAQALLGVVGALAAGRGEGCLEGQADGGDPIGGAAGAVQAGGEPLHGGEVEGGHCRAAALDGEVGGGGSDVEREAVRAVELQAGDEALQEAPELDAVGPGAEPHQVDESVGVRLVVAGGGEDVRRDR